MKKHSSEDIFRHDLRKFTRGVIEKFGLQTETTVSLGTGESLEINPRYNFGVVLRLIEHDDRSGYEHSFSLVVRRSAEIDVLDEQLRYKPLDQVDAFEASTRIHQAQIALSQIQSV